MRKNNLLSTGRAASAIVFVILICLRALSHTAVDGDDGESTVPACHTFVVAAGLLAKKRD